METTGIRSAPVLLAGDSYSLYLAFFLLLLSFRQFMVGVDGLFVWDVGIFFFNKDNTHLMC